VLEMAARRQALHLAARSLEQQLNGDTDDHVGRQLPCACGGSARYHGRHSKTFESVLGPLHLQRAYYHCEQCQSGFCPRDRASQSPFLKIIGKTDGSFDFHFYDFYGLLCRPLVKNGSHCVYSFRPLATFRNGFHKDRTDFVCDPHQDSAGRTRKCGLSPSCSNPDEPRTKQVSNSLISERTVKRHIS
jgi:hypothetical protein